MKHTRLAPTLVLAIVAPAFGQVLERMERPNGATVEGRVVGDAAKGFRFVPGDGSEPFALAKSGGIRFEPTKPRAGGYTPPFHVTIGRDQRISGRLVSVDRDTIRLDDGPGGKPVAIKRKAALSLMQRQGEAGVLEESFEKLDPERWTSNGSPSIADDVKLTGDHALMLPAGGNSVVCRLSDPVGQGRVEVAFHDDGKVVPREQTLVELSFRGAIGPETVRAILGWSEDSLAVESPGGPALAVQRLSRKPGWRRLGIRFGSETTDVSIDGDELAHGKGPRGPLIEIRLSTRTVGSESGSTPKGLVARFDDLRVVRFTTPGGEVEVDPDQDELRLTNGDQNFGSVIAAKPEGVVLKINGRDFLYPWNEVAGVRFKRETDPLDPVSGLLVRLEWRMAPGNDPRDVDAAEGALVAATEDALELQTPQAGRLTIPRSALRRLRVLGTGTRVVLDPFPHHMGDDVSEAPDFLDPPQPEGGMLERTVVLDKDPVGPARLTLDVVQVVGEAPALKYSNKIREGELRTNVHVNGKYVDYINRFITTNNETPETITVTIPPGLLKAGKNTVKFELIGFKAEPTSLDDLGILGIVLDYETGPAAAPR